MDNYFTNWGEIETMSLRLQTKRRKIRSIKAGIEKTLIRLDKERKHIWKERNRNRNTYVDLKPPYQSGWKRTFVVRTDIAQSRHAIFFESILTKINTVVYSHRKDFKVKKRKFGRKVYVNREQNLTALTEHEMDKIFTSRQKQLFSEVWQTTKRGTLEKRYVFTEPWRFVLKVKPNMITQVRLVNEELESDYQRLENYVDTHHLQCKIDRAKSESYRHWRFVPKDGKRCEHKRTLRQYLDSLS